MRKKKYFCAHKKSYDNDKKFGVTIDFLVQHSLDFLLIPPLRIIINA